jgi:hypothetical protein
LPAVLVPKLELGNENLLGTMNPGKLGDHRAVGMMTGWLRLNKLNDDPEVKI